MKNLALLERMLEVTKKLPVIDFSYIWDESGQDLVQTDFVLNNFEEALEGYGYAIRLGDENEKNFVLCEFENIKDNVLTERDVLSEFIGDVLGYSPFVDMDRTRTPKEDGWGRTWNGIHWWEILYGYFGEMAPKILGEKSDLDVWKEWK